MNEIPVTEEMKQKIAPFFSEETGRYDIDATRKYEKDNWQGSSLSYTFALFFGGHEDEEPEHTMVSAAVQLNQELDAQDEEIQNTAAFIQDVLAVESEQFHSFINSNVKSRFNRFTEANQRHFVAELLHLHETTRDAKRDSKQARICNRVYFMLDLLNLSDDLPGDIHVQVGGYSLKKAREFVRNDDDSEFFTRLPEEYLASLGL